MKILIVDDDATNRTVLDAFLRRDQHEIVSAENGVEAIAFFERHRPDVIFMDVMMPVMNGYTATREIKGRCLDEFIPVIFLTALSDEASLAKCIECGGDDFLTKPYSATLLRSKLDAMSRIRSLHQAVTGQKKQLELYQQETDHEIQLAKHVFNAVTSDRSSKASNIKIWTSTVSHFSGDLVLQEKTPSGQHNVMLGDFTGHGLSAAIGALPTADAFYSMTGKGFGIADIAGEINNKLHHYLPTGHFCAAALVNVDTKKGRIEIWNGGVPPIILMGNDGHILRIIQSSKLPLGVVESNEFDRNTDIIQLSQVSSIIICSDGLTELQNQDNEFFGFDGLTRAITEKNPGEQVCNALQDKMHHFMAGRIPDDDLTLVEIQCRFTTASQTIRLPQQPRSRENTAAEWAIDLYLTTASLAVADPVPFLIEWMMHLRMPDHQRQQIYIILTELINNAIEHGVLNLDSSLKDTPQGFEQYYKLREERLKSIKEGHLRVRMAQIYAGYKAITIKIEDSGIGFNAAEFMDNLDSGRSYGRGIGLVKAICNDVEYKDCGNRVEAEYIIKEESGFNDGADKASLLKKRVINVS